MGVHGLWRLIEPSGKPVPVESLENKILAVDVSIWLHQAIKGFQDAKGAPALNAHLLGIFHRVCKLLYFKIKPVFVFDGGVPVLKRETIAKRNKLKHKNISEADKIQKQLLDTLMKHSAVNKVLGEKAKTELASASSSKQESSRDDLFKLPKIEEKSGTTDEESSSESDFGSPTKNWNLHNIDTKSEHFKSLPADVRHEILTELKETRKQSSWGRLHELPTQSDEFSGFQMKRLLKRQEVQLAIEEAQKEMGGHSLSLAELEELLKDQGVISKNEIGNRIASDENTRYLYIKDVKQALEKARREDEKKKLNAIKEDEEKCGDEKVEIEKNKADLELETDIQRAIALSLQEQPSTSSQVSKQSFSFLENFEDADFDSDTDDELQIEKNTKLSSAQNYMMEYSGLTPNEIAKIIADNAKNKPKKRKLVSISGVASKGTEAGRTEKNIGPDLKDEDKSVEPNIKKIKLIENKKSSENEKDFEEVKSHIMENESMNSQVNINSEIPKNMAHEDKILNEEKNMKNEINFKEIDEETKTKESKEDEPSTVDAPIGVISGSEESENDFEEVEEIPFNNSKIEAKNVMEIKIEEKEFNEEDDLFADIFTLTETNDEKILMETGEEKKENVASENVSENIETLQDLIKEDDKIETKINNKIYEDKQKITQKDQVKLTDKDLEALRDDLNKEQIELRSEQGLRERLAANITDQMYQEAQDLLELFGLPFVVAPMEAEAQCAFLESASLTDGTITDDSDIWLFGGKTVYKNFFNQSKHVLEYRAEDIKHHFKLTREQMILLALLVGSDYTTGLQGVGPVTAMEILANFPPSSTSNFTLSHNQLLMGLTEFKSWFTSGKSIARTKNSLRNKLKNVTFIDGFPSMQVVQAYLNPTIDQSKEEFSWSKPDLVSLIDFGRSKFGWSKEKTQNLLDPVMKRMKESKYQKTLLNYFKIKHDLNAEQAQKLMSERVRSAVKRIGQDPKDIEESDESDKEIKKNKKKKGDEDGTKVSAVKQKTKKKIKDVKELLSDDELIELDQIEKLLETVEKDKSKKGRKKKVVKPSKLLEKTESEGSMQTRECESSEEKSMENIETLKKEDPIPLLENNEMNLLIKVLSNQEPCTSENAAKIAKVRKIAKKIERVKNPELKEQELAVVPKKKKSKKIGDDNITEEPSPSKRESNVMKLQRIVKKLEGKNVEKSEVKKPLKKKKIEATTSKTTDNVEKELKLLKETKAFSEKHAKELEDETKKMLEVELKKKTLIERKLHRKEIIPQRERSQKNLMNTRLKAIEVFRKSKIDPSSKKVGTHKIRPPKHEAELSESSSDSDL